MGLRQGVARKTVGGLAWSFASQGGRQLLQLLITAALARLLSPADFGLLAMAAVFVNFTAIFSEMGVSSALIQKQDVHDRHYSSAFWLNVLVGAALTAFFAACSPLVAAFYGKPELRPLLSALSPTFIVSSLAIVHRTVLAKQMDFRKLAVLELLAVLASGAVGIAMACKGWGVWSLAGQTLSLAIADCALLWILSPWRPRFAFAKTDIGDIFRFSANVTGFNLANFFARNADQLLIGKVLGAEALGFYSLAYKLVLNPLQNVSWATVRVMFPAFSRIQHDRPMLKAAYLESVNGVTLAAAPALLALLALAPDFVSVIYGSSWEPSVPVIQILCVCGIFQAVNAMAGGAILSQGRSALQLKLGVWGAFFAVLATAAGLRWGIIGVAALYTAEQILWIGFVQTIVARLVSIRPREFLEAAKSGFLAGALLSAMLALAQNLAVDATGSGRLAACLAAAAIVHAVFLWRSDPMRRCRSLFGRREAAE